jgi:hypothetical protein
MPICLQPLTCRWVIPIGLALCACLVGCTSFESRARAKPATYAELDQPTRVRLKAQKIQLGDTPDMVYLALGPPTSKHDKTSAAGHSTLWTYTAYWQQYEGTRLVGYRQDVLRNQATKTYQVHYTPDYQPIYTLHSEDRIRIEFQNGLVSTVEQTQTNRKNSH